MKHLYLIGGTMGVGKTTVSKLLMKKLPDSVFLDGDWCWDASPFTVNDETKAMVMDNICHMLNNFIHCSAYSNIVFCWVMHQQEIIDDILSRLDTKNVQIIPVSLIADETALKKRLSADIEAGIRMPDIIERSQARLPMYASVDTIKIDTSNMTPESVAEAIALL